MTDRSRHPIVRLFVPPEHVEITELRLWDLGATGLEQHDQSTIVRGTDQSRVTLTVAFGDEPSARAALDALDDAFDAELSFLDDANWAIEWRRGFGPQRIGERLLLQPSWEPARETDERVVVTIDPENAFGSGDHETTRLVLQALDRRIQGGERVLDVGCGSGVLSIAALKLGAASACGIDIEDDAIAVARRNAGINEVAPRFEASVTPLEHVRGVYDVVLANIETRVLTQMPALLWARCAPGGVLILSGVLTEERQSILDAYDTADAVETLAENEWLAFVMAEKSR